MSHICNSQSRTVTWKNFLSPPSTEESSSYNNERYATHKKTNVIFHILVTKIIFYHLLQTSCQKIIRNNSIYQLILISFSNSPATEELLIGGLHSSKCTRCGGYELTRPPGTHSRQDTML